MAGPVSGACVLNETLNFREISFSAGPHDGRGVASVVPSNHREGVSKRAQEASRTGGERIGVYEKLRKSALRRRGPLGDECQLQVGDFPIHGGMPREEGDDAHRPSAAGAGQGVDLVNLADNGRPALGGDAPQLLLDNAQRESRKARLADLTPVGGGVEAVIARGK